MNKLLLSAVMAASIAGIAPSVEARTGTTSTIVDPQQRVPPGRGDGRYQRQRDYRDRKRVVVSTRIVGFGRNRYRETIRTTYYPNGREETRVISRERFYGFPR